MNDCPAVEQSRQCLLVPARTKHATEDRLDEFINQGKWQWPHRYSASDVHFPYSRHRESSLDLIRAIEIGTNIAIRDFGTKEESFDLRPSKYEDRPWLIRARGVVSSNPGNGLELGVQWEKLSTPRLWFYDYGFHALRVVKPGSWRDDALLRCVLDDEPQNLDLFRSAHLAIPKHCDETLRESLVAFICRRLTIQKGPDWTEKLKDAVSILDIEKLLGLLADDWSDMFSELLEGSIQAQARLVLETRDALVRRKVHSAEELEAYVEATANLCHEIDDAKSCRAIRLIIGKTEEGRPDELTGRDLEILPLVSKGMSNAEIGKALNLSEKTVEGNVIDTYSKLGLNGRTHLAAWAVYNGLAEP
jgi:DNA-binding NarL/FixJ family response regulator